MSCTISPLGQVYASALFDLAREAKLLDAVKSDLEAVCNIEQQDAEFAAFAASPYFTNEVKAGVVRRLLAGRVADLTLDFMMVVIRRNRLKYLADMTAAYNRLWDDFNGYKDVTVTVAQAVDAAEIKKISDEISSAIASKVKLKLEIDESILGGIVIRYGDNVIDNSARAQLERAVKTIMTRQGKAEINEV